MQPHDTTNEIPHGYCHCGCGQKTSIAKRNDPRWGYVKGRPVRFIKGHDKRIKIDYNPNPSGLCMCGCGQQTPIAERTDLHGGQIAGKPLRFIHPHQNRVIAKLPLESRFWSKVNRRGPDDCWLWQGAMMTSGYGMFSIDNCYQGAHRVSWELHFGVIPDDIFVCHHCDVKICVNPAHLFLGTVHENIEDKMNKDRQAKGEGNGQAKLNERHVIRIRKLFADGAGVTELGRQFGVSHATIHRVVTRKLWAHID